MVEIKNVEICALSPVSIRDGNSIDTIFSIHPYVEEGKYKVVDKKKLLASEQVPPEDLKLVVSHILSGNMSLAQGMVKGLVKNAGAYGGELPYFSPNEVPEVQDPSRVYSVVSIRDGLAYIPGSSLKGSFISTLYFMAQKNGEDVKSEIEQFFPDPRARKKSEKRLYKKKVIRPDGRIGYEIQKDYLVVRDTMPEDVMANTFISTEANLRIKSRKTRYGSQRAEGVFGPRFVVQYIAPGSKFSSTLKKDNVTDASWLNGPEKFIYDKSLKELEQTLVEFASIVADRELGFWSQVEGDGPENDAKVEKIKADLICFWKDIKNDPKPILLLGFGKKAHTKLEGELNARSRNVTFFNGKYFPIGVVSVNFKQPA